MGELWRDIERTSHYTFEYAGGEDVLLYGFDLLGY